MSRRVLLVLVLSAALGAASGGAERIVAIGDIHGAYEELVEILQESQLVDEDLSWIGDDATLVQLGDYTDRGPGVKEVMDLLMRLEVDAPRAGGRVEVLLGNHEALNLVGELRDVSAETLRSFAPASDPEEREREYREVVKAARRRAKLTGSPRPSSDDQAREAWMETHPEGTIPYLRQLLPDGSYGGWLRKRPTVVRTGDVLFLHAGLAPEVSSRTPDAINRQVWNEISRLDACRSLLREEGYLTLTSTTAELIRAGFALLEELQQKDPQKLSDEEAAQLRTLGACVDYEDWHLFATDGPLWFRGYADPRPERPGRQAYGWSEEEGRSLVRGILEQQGVRHIVVAHSTRRDGTIGVRFGGRVFLIDTGMLEEVYGGRPSALEIVQGTFTALYPGRREVVWEPSQRPVPEAPAPAETTADLGPDEGGWSWLGPQGDPLPVSSPEELQELLRTAEVVSTKTISSGINRPQKVLLQKDGVMVNAVFRTVDVEVHNKQGPGGKFFRRFRDSYLYENAAYELGRLLGLGRVPPVVLRNLRGENGSLQAWVENAMSEAERRQQDIRPPDTSRWARQQMERQVFDALINNQDRHEGNSLIDSRWRVWLIDHTRSFFLEYGDERIRELRRCPRDLWESLRRADRAEVEERLDPYLNPAEIAALFERWDRILLRLRTLIAEHGREAVIME